MNIESLKTSKRAQGRLELLKHMQGKPLIRSKAILAKCYECTNGYVDGKVDCCLSDCPLYPFMPFKDQLNEPSLSLDPPVTTPSSDQEPPNHTEVAE